MTMKKYHLIWNESLHSVGISLIDRQHREIIEMVNQIADRVAQRDQSEAVQELFEGLILFAREHFALEERLMVEHGFPDMKSHIEEHRKLFLQLNNLIKAGLRAPGNNKAALVSAFLTDWAEQHILRADKELGEFLIAKGLS
jgi:hemerythrin